MYQIYCCEYCTTLDSKEKIEKHERLCVNNPETKSCRTCKNCHIESGNIGKGITCKVGIVIHKEKCYPFEYFLRKNVSIRSNCDKYEFGEPSESEFNAI